MDSKIFQIILYDDIGKYKTIIAKGTEQQIEEYCIEEYNEFKHIITELNDFKQYGKYGIINIYLDK